MREIFRELLIDATNKLIELRTDKAWAAQLPPQCPPILWFGDAFASRPRVLTFGANPSPREYLGSRSPTPWDYLKKPRFYVLAKNEHLKNILKSREIQDRIIAGYNEYFTPDHNPYHQWFGHDRDDSYKVEGFLRGCGASYFGENGYQQAIHIDLFPFATRENFGDITKVVETDLFNNFWAQNFVKQLVKAFSPTTLIVFGRTNCCYFQEYIDPDLKQEWRPYEAAKSEYFVGSSSKFPGTEIIGLSTNLGNPKGFTAASLRGYGEFIRWRTR